MLLTLKIIFHYTDKIGKYETIITCANAYGKAEYIPNRRLFVQHPQPVGQMMRESLIRTF